MTRVVRSPQVTGSETTSTTTTTAHSTTITATTTSDGQTADAQQAGPGPGGRRHHTVTPLGERVPRNNNCHVHVRPAASSAA